MNVRICIPKNGKLPPAYRRAAGLRTDLGRAVGLYGLGDRSAIVLRILAAGKAAYDAVGATVPRPVNMDGRTWVRILNELKHQYGERSYQDCDESTDCVALAG